MHVKQSLKKLNRVTLTSFTIVVSANVILEGKRKRKEMIISLGIVDWTVLPIILS